MRRRIAVERCGMASRIVCAGLVDLARANLGRDGRWPIRPFIRLRAGRFLARQRAIDDVVAIRPPSAHSLAHARLDQEVPTLDKFVDVPLDSTSIDTEVGS
jgi:hypothetical protein